MLQSTDNTITRQDMIDKSNKMLSKNEIEKIYSETTITAKYFYNNTWFKAITNSYSDGTITGQNNVGSSDKGRWEVSEDGVLSLEWDEYWESWSAFGYRVQDEVMFFDTDTGKWRITLSIIEDGELSVEM